MSLTFPRLNTHHLPEILELLTETWPLLYGETGCPNFNLPYLQWLYGGPNADRNMILGCRDESGRLVGVKSALFRDMRLHGKAVDAYRDASGNQARAAFWPQT